MGVGVTGVLLDAAGALAFGLAAGGAGWWAKSTVEERRMRRLLARIHAELSASRGMVER